MGRRLVVCLDGTSNEPESGSTNVTRFYALSAKNADQLVYYDPGVGTMGDRGAITPAGKAVTRFMGLVVGYGIKDNVAEAYQWLMSNYRAGDRIYIVGFSRGAYTALALTGLIRTVGLLRPGAENLIPYALKLYVKNGKKNPSDAEESRYWKVRDDFNRQFGNPEFPGRFERQVEFLGLWDTVKSVGWLNLRAKFQQARWPFTRLVPSVAHGRLALAVDERRRPFTEYRFDEAAVEKGKGRLAEVWFTGTHSDVGGCFPDDHGLSDIALRWMVEEARSAELEIGEQTSPSPADLPPIHRNPWWWAVIGLGWRQRPIRSTDTLHPSVHQRVATTANARDSYRPDLKDHA